MNGRQDVDRQIVVDKVIASGRSLWLHSPGSRSAASRASFPDTV